MSYKVDYNAIQDLLGSYSSALAEWSKGVSCVVDKEIAIAASKNIDGNKASRMKQYLNTTYSCAKDSLFMLLEMFRQKFLLYSDAYYRQIDSARDTYIDETELSDLRSDLQRKKSEIQQIGLQAESAVKKVSDLVTVSSLDVSDLDAEFVRTLSSLDDLDNGVNALESSHVSSDFADIDALISKLDAFFVELIGQDKNFKTSFSVESFAALSSVPGLITALHNAYDQFVAQESDVTVATQHLEERLESQRAEIEERERNAKWFKIGVAVIATIATAVAIGTGVGTLIVPVIAGVAKYSLNAMADEYVKHGFETDQWDQAYIGKEAIKGWFSGFTSGILPPGTGNVVKATVSGANSALWGGLDNAYDQLTTTGKVSDTRSVFYDAAKSGTSSFTSTLVGGVVGDKVKEMPIGLGLDKYVNPSDDFRHVAGNFISGSTEKVTSGVVERFTSTTVETTFDVGRNLVDGKDALDSIDLGDRYSKVVSLENIGEDFVLGGVKGSVTNYYREHTTDPKTGLTPIIQAKLGYETDPRTGTTPIIQEVLSHTTDEEGLHNILGEMEARNPSKSVHATDVGSTTAGLGETPDFSRTSLTPSEERLVREMDDAGDFKFGKEDYSTINSTMNFIEAKPPTMNTPTGEHGTWLGDRGNSGYIPDDPKAQAVMKEYGQESIKVTNNHPSFSPFTDHDTPWGRQQCEVKIGHMTGGRQGSEGNYAQADEALAAKIGGGVTGSDIRRFREDKNNGLTWHESEDGTTMQLIPTIINSSVSHTGGTSISGYGQKMGDIAHEYE